MHYADPTTPSELDELTRLELDIARRADELTRVSVAGQIPRDHWLNAEREVWQAWFGQSPHQLAS